MKLISAVLKSKMLMMAVAIMTTTLLNARVFWNKVEVTSDNNNSVTLSWNVTEYNNKSFIIQHSLNGNDWEDIAVIPSKNSPESITDYSYTHKNKLNGKQFYRLKDFDVDTRNIGISPVKTITLENSAQSVSIWPNPASSHVQIANDHINNYTKARITDLSGKIMLEKKLESNITDISIEGLTTGIYVIRVENGKGEGYAQKLVKQ